MSLSKIKVLAVVIVCLFIGTSFTPRNFIEKVKADYLDDIKESEKNFCSVPKNDKEVDWWPMFSHDSNHSGFSTSKAPDTANLKWMNQQTQGWPGFSCAINDGYIYYGTWGKKIICLDLNDGSVIWSVGVGGSIQSGPAVVDEKVYIGSYDGNMYCLDAYNGSSYWSYQTGNYIVSSPVIYNDEVFFGSRNHKAYCLNKENGTEIWNFTATGPFYYSPAIEDNKVYIGSEDYSLYCLNAINGSLIWKYTTNGFTYSPSIANEYVYAGSSDNYIYCIYKNDGTLKWKYQTNGNVESCPAIYNNRIYFGSNDYKLYCLDAYNGSYIWSYSANDLVISSPAIADGKVYVGSHDDNIYCLNADTGENIWTYPTGWNVYSSPAIADGKVVIASIDDLYCFSIPPLIADFTYIPINPTVNDQIFFTDNSTSNNGVIINWTWDFGDGNTSNIQNPTHQYTAPSNYTVCLNVTDDDGATDEVCKQVIVSPGNLPPYKPNTPTGQIDCTVGVVYDFQTSTTDPEDNQLYYLFDWDDGSEEIWVGPYDSGELIISSHSWSEHGIFEVRVKAKDSWGDESVWSDPLNVTVIPTEQLDVDQSVFDRGFPIRHAIDGDWAGAQNFTPTLDTLTRVDIYLRKFGTPEFNLTVELRMDGPRGTLIDTLTFTPTEVPSSWDWFTVDFTDTTITPGTDYFIVCPPAPSGVTTSFGYEWGYAFGNQYDGGSFWFTRDGGGLWRDLPTMYEFVFRTYGYS